MRFSTFLVFCSLFFSLPHSLSAYFSLSSSFIQFCTSLSPFLSTFSLDFPSYLYFILSDALCHQINICIWNQQIFLKKGQKGKKIKVVHTTKHTKTANLIFFFSLCACGRVFLLYDVMFSIKGIVKNVETLTKSI